MSEYGHDAALVRGYIGTVNSLYRKVDELDEKLSQDGLIDRWQVANALNGLESAAQALESLARYLTD